MAWPAAIATREFWSAAGNSATRLQWEFDGEAGLRALSGPQMVFTAGAPEFHARLQRLQLHRYALEAFSASPHTAARGPVEISAYAVPLSGIVLVERGRLRVETADRSFSVDAGQAFLLDTCHTSVCTSEVETELLRAFAFRASLPGADRLTGTLPVTPLAQSLLLDKFFRLARVVLRNDSFVGSGGEELLSAAFLQLHSALLQEAPRNCCG